ncbi:MAG TPA: hypothetical protein VH761_07675, partial [Ilumatobacteraceae bacterium]
TRVLDTRPASQVGPRNTPLGAKQMMDFTISGLPDDATAVAVNVTVADGTTGSFLQVYPTTATQPGTSTVNWASANAVANAAIVPILADRSLRVYNDQGSVNVIIDLTGYYAPSPSGGGAGTQGPKGDQGIPGPKGDKGDKGDPGVGGAGAFLYATNTSPESLATFAPVTFDTTGPVSGISVVPPTPGFDPGAFSIDATGVYRVSFGVMTVFDGSQFNVRVNDIDPGGLVFGSDSAENEGTALISLTAGDVISVVNGESGGGGVDVDLNTTLVGGVNPTANAWILIEQIG